jgi:hypothetical protein
VDKFDTLHKFKLIIFYFNFILFFNLKIALTAFLKKPIITSDSHFFAKNGLTFTLTCEVEMTDDVPYMVNFTLPNGSHAENNDFLELSDIKHEHENRRKATRTLKIKSGDEHRDQGDYKCILIDLRNNTNSAIISIKFVSEPIVELNTSNPIIKTRKGKKTARFLIDYFAYPNATFTIYDPENNTIAKDKDIMKRDKFDVEIDKFQIKFTIKFPEIEDFGTYTLEAISDGQVFTKNLQLIVSG